MSTADREITEGDRQAADNLKRLWDEVKTKRPITQEIAALEMGMSQGAVSQFMLGKVPLGLKATLKFAAFLGVAPEQIRPDFPELAGIQLNPNSMDSLISDLPISDQQQVLDFIEYRVEKSEGLIASEKMSRYVTMIEKLKRDLDERKKRDGDKRP